jgi:hypothetical protein
MNELDEQDIALIVYSLEEYSVCREWHPIAKASILMVLQKMKEIQLNN